uniref:Uncharacterized protein n=1 Tax=Anguilla anguilla TaxID=7936 RepID=A0A0E9W8E9_ANGAN
MRPDTRYSTHYVMKTPQAWSSAGELVIFLEVKITTATICTERGCTRFSSHQRSASRLVAYTTFSLALLDCICPSVLIHMTCTLHYIHSVGTHGVKSNLKTKGISTFK